MGPHWVATLAIPPGSETMAPGLGEGFLGAVRLAFSCELRRRWRAWLAIAILISVAGGIVLAATAAGRRTESAFPDFVAAHGFDADVYAVRPLSTLAKLPGVTSVAEIRGPNAGQPACKCTYPINPTEFGVLVTSSEVGRVFKLVSGTLPDPSSPDQVLASFTLQQDGVHLGSVIRVPFYSRAQASALYSAIGAPPKPNGPAVALRVVGFEAAEFEFPSGTTPSYDLYTTPAFARTVLPQTVVGYVYLVRLRGGAAALPRFEVAVHGLFAAGAEGVGGQDQQAASVEASIHPQALGWWILALLAALVGLAVIGQALARQSNVEGEDYPTMAALGADRRQLVMLAAARNLVLALAGAAGAVLIAAALSPVAPLGEARIAETSTGVTLDPLVLSLGALATIVAVIALGLWPAVRVAGTSRPNSRGVPPHRSAAVALLTQAGVPPSAVVGVHNALQSRTGRAGVPVGSALVGTVLAVTALCGTAVFGAGLAHLTTTPRLYGEPFQLNFTDAAVGTGPPAGMLARLEHDSAVTAITRGFATEIAINKVAVGAVAEDAVRGRPLFSTVAGHLPNREGQIGLGETTMRQVGARLGSVVEVSVSLPSGGRRTVPFHVVSQVSLPVLSGVVSLGSGAVFTISGYESAVCAPGLGQEACREAVTQETNGGGFLVSFVSGARGQAAINHYLEKYESVAALGITPTSLVNFGEAVDFPLIFGAMLALFGAATLAHLLAVSVSRRRREVGLLKVLGFVNRQVASAVGWQATTLALIGVVVGVPLGVVAGRTIWNAFADNLGVVPVTVVPIWLLCVLVAGVVIVANVIAVVPALAATRSKPGELLRTL
ncbi:MAG: FtsX-like permease family protein [Acidimicrobiales bacterium]